MDLPFRARLGCSSANGTSSFPYMEHACEEQQSGPEVGNPARCTILQWGYLGKPAVLDPFTRQHSPSTPQKQGQIDS